MRPTTISDHQRGTKDLDTALSRPIIHIRLAGTRNIKAFSLSTHHERTVTIAAYHGSGSWIASTAYMQLDSLIDGSGPLRQAINQCPFTHVSVPTLQLTASQLSLCMFTVGRLSDIR